MDPVSITAAPKTPKQKKMSLEEFRELFEKMCTEYASEMHGIMIKHGVLN